MPSKTLEIWEMVPNGSQWLHWDLWQHQCLKFHHHYCILQFHSLGMIFWLGSKLKKSTHSSHYFALGISFFLPTLVLFVGGMYVAGHLLLKWVGHLPPNSCNPRDETKHPKKTTHPHVLCKMNFVHGICFTLNSQLGFKFFIEVLWHVFVWQPNLDK